MTDLAPVFGIVGALAAFPRRLAARAVEAQRRRRCAAASAARPPTSSSAAGCSPAPPRPTIEARVAAERAAGRTLLSRDRLPAPARPRRPATDERHLAPHPGRRRPDRGRARPAHPVRRLRARRRALVVPRPDPRAQVRGAAPRGRELVGDRPLGAPLRPGRRPDRRDARRRPLPRRPRSASAEPDGQLRLDLGARRETPRSSSPPPRPPRPRAGSSEAAALYHRCLALDPGDALAAFNRANVPAAPSAGPRRRTATTCAPPASTAASPRPSSTSAASPATAATAPPPAAISPAPSPSTPTMPTPSTTSRRSSSTPATSTPPARTGGTI